MADAIVLIVDDNEKNLRLVREILQASGFSTLEAASGEQAISVAAAELPDVILMDIRLPDIDGTVAAARLKDDPRTAAIPIVALTSLAMKGDRERFLASGFDGYLEKPISVRELADQVRGFCADQGR
jgi:two-component system cell cycle response regulator DivK